MWFPDAPLIRVGLSQQGITMVRSKRLGRGQAPEPERLACVSVPGQGEPWRAAVDCLAQWLGGHNERHKGQRLKVCVVLSGRFVRWQLLPWRAEVSGQGERAAFAALRFREVFGKTADAWSIAPASLAPGRSAPAGAVDGALVAALQKVCADHGAQLQQLTPYFSAAFDSWRSRIKPAAAWFATLEADTLTLGLLIDGRWAALQSQRLGGDWREPLRALMAQITMASGLAEPAPALYLAGDLAQPPASADLAFTWLSPQGRAAQTTPGARLAWGC